MVNIIPPDHVEDVLAIEPNQHDDVLVVPEPVLVDEDEDPKEEEFEEEEEPHEEEDDMEVDFEEDENEPKFTYPYEEPLPLASDSEPENVIEVEDMIKSEDETVPASDINSLFGRMDSLLRRLCGREMAHALVEKKGKEKDAYYGKLILDLGNEVRSSVEQGTAAMEKLNERVERDLYWTRVRAHEFYREMTRKGFVFKERPNEAIDVLIEDEKSPSSEPQGSPRDSKTVPPKSAPLTKAAIRQMIKEGVDAAIAAKQARHANARNDARGSGLVRGQDAAPAVRECTIAGFMKCKILLLFMVLKELSNYKDGPALTWWNAKVATMGLETVNQMPWTEMKQLMTVEFCLIEEVQRMKHELWNLKVKEFNIVAYTQRKVKQEEVREFYAIKDAEPQGPNVVTEVISCIKARKYVERGCHLFLAHVTKKKLKEKQLKGMPVIRDFPEVFLEDLLGLPPPRQVEFRIDLVPRAAPITHAPYRSASSEMRELSVQLQELLKKGFIHSSSSP
nr:putative reverse transcriptase domain-containing protein [Tanacetum cinerariifolium]